MATKEVLVEKESTSIVCNVCKEVINGRIVTALGKTWHPEHFTCAHCSRAIAGDKFHQRDGAVHCVECYTQHYMHRCHACREPIANKVIQALGVSWHEEHFVCAECKKSLAGGGFMEVAGLPYCSDCHAGKFAARCYGCTKPITDKAIIALDNKWHQGCFKCVKCANPVTDSTFQVLDNKPLCNKCS